MNLNIITYCIITLLIVACSGAKTSSNNKTKEDSSRQYKKKTTPAWIGKVGFDPSRGKYDAIKSPNKYGGRNYFMAPNGNDKASGSKHTPWKTFSHANRKVKPGDIVYLRGGVHHVELVQLGQVGRPDANKRNTYSVGLPNKPITWRSYPGELAVIEWKNMGKGGAKGPFSVTWLFRLYKVKWNIFKNLVIRNNPHYGGIAIVNSSNNVFENVHTYGHTGQGQAGVEAFNNKFLYCTASNNYGPRANDGTNGQNGDGFSFSSGGENEFRYCMAYHNSDDGFDVWKSLDNKLEYCISKKNGYVTDKNGKEIMPDADRDGRTDGDGNGFKLGGNKHKGGGGNYVAYCLAYQNARRGFTLTGPINKPCTLYNNTSFENGMYGFDLRSNAHKAVNNLSYKDCAINDCKTEQFINGKVKAENNSWNLSTTLKESDFLSLDPEKLGAGFLMLKKESSAANTGTKVSQRQSSKSSGLGAMN